MFSGIIEHTTKILSVCDGLFTVENPFSEELSIGQSIAHDGACMTLTHIADNHYSFFAMEETFKKTNFSIKQPGDTFNLECSLRLSDRLDGHLVSGHVDTVGYVTELIKNHDDSLIVRVQITDIEKKFLVLKGSITLNGVSLTIIDISADTVSVSLIPLTQKWTNLGTLKVGEVINVEYDMIAKYVAQMIVV